MKISSDKNYSSYKNKVFISILKLWLSVAMLMFVAWFSWLIMRFDTLSLGNILGIMIALVFALVIVIFLQIYILLFISKLKGS